ncbi:MAG: HPr family phosphocarrier protein [Hyphomicrobiales bacterium]|nr:HPr family phosphocarrier protein [Hyphomicrobiales bacterium]
MSQTEATVLLTHAVGLHARPSVKLTKLAKAFQSTIAISASADGPWIDAKSIVKVMGAKVPQGATLHFRASGEDADDAVAALIRLVEGDFDEAATNAVGD